MEPQCLQSACSLTPTLQKVQWWCSSAAQGLSQRERWQQCVGVTVSGPPAQEVSPAAPDPHPHSHNHQTPLRPLHQQDLVRSSQLYLVPSWELIYLWHRPHNAWSVAGMEKSACLPDVSVTEQNLWKVPNSQKSWRNWACTNSVYQALFSLPTHESPVNEAIKYPVTFWCFCVNYPLKKCLKLCFGHLLCTVCAVFQTDEMKGQDTGFLMVMFIISNAAQAGIC